MVSWANLKTIIGRNPMLNRPKLVQELAHVSQRLFHDSSQEIQLAFELWQKISQDPTFSYKCRAARAPWLVPTWNDTIGEVIKVEPIIDKYVVIAVDGSQIYPDRHQKAGCYVINIGAVELRYGLEGKRISLDSTPYVFGLEDADFQGESITDTVNCRREELELNGAYEYGLKIKQELNAEKSVVLLDGSLIFWHLEGKEEAFKDRFLTSYCATLERFAREQILVASYVSFPKSKELINLLRLFLCDFKPENASENKTLDYLVDTHIMRFFLEPYERTIIFQNHASIAEKYPASIHPYFFYIHTGAEIGRVEIPAWIAQDAHKADIIAQVILDQTIKGRGYLVCLAEAHEQAVIKGPDRDFFYHVLQKVG